MSQVLYKNALALFPRVVPSQPMLDAYLSDLGDLSDREKEAYSLLLFMMNAATLYFDGTELDDIVEEPFESQDKPDEASAIDQDALVSENERLSFFRKHIEKDAVA